MDFNILDWHCVYTPHFPSRQSFSTTLAWWVLLDYSSLFIIYFMSISYWETAFHSRGEETLFDEGKPKYSQSALQAYPADSSVLGLFYSSQEK